MATDGSAFVPRGDEVSGGDDQAESYQVAQADTASDQTETAAIATVVTPDANNVVRLPADVTIEEFRVDGPDLILIQRDGSEIRVVGGAADLPTFIIDDVEVPRQVLVAVLEASGFDVAAGPDGSLSVQPGDAQNSGHDVQDLQLTNPGDAGQGFLKLLDGSATPTGATAGNRQSTDSAVTAVGGDGGNGGDAPNSPPVLTGDLAVGVNEGGIVIIGAADLGFTDADDLPSGVIFSVGALVNGVVLVNGLPATSFTGADLAAGLVTFHHDGSETLTASFSVSVEDGNEDGSTPIAQTFNLIVNPVNDAPVNAMPGAESVDEDTTLVFSIAHGNAVTISDADAGGGDVTVTLTVTSGTLVLGSTAGLTAFTNNAASITLTGTVANVNAALDGLAYTGSLNFNGADSLTVVTSDNGNTPGPAQTDTDTVAITVNPVNDAPVLTVGPAPVVPSLQQFSNATPTAIADAGTTTSTIVVSGANPYLLDLNLLTFIRHTFPGDLDITITSPSGTVVTITTDNAGTNDDVFNGTIWDDSADPAGQVPYVTNQNLVTDRSYAVGVVATNLVPEGSFGAFIGENPNGAWTITIVDDAAVDIGSLESWRLDLVTLPAAPVTVDQTFANTTPVTIPDGPSVITSTIVVSGAPDRLLDVNLRTFITHSFPGDLDITLTSPSGTVVTITTDNAGTNDNVFNGTLWDDNGTVTVTDSAYAVGVLAPSLIPEEALAAFIGENPNGVWTITISDDAAVDGGALNSWSLDFKSYSGAPIPTYVEDQPALVIAPAATVSDVDSATLAGATIAITANLEAGTDILSFTDQNGITGSYNAATGVLTLTGTASVADYQAALRSVTFASVSDTPSTAPRTISLQVDDGAAANNLSTVQTVVIGVLPAPDAPVNSVPGVQTVNEDGVFIFNTFNGNLISVSDVDAGAGLVTVTLSVSRGALSIIGVPPGLTFSVGDGILDTTMTFTGTIADVNDALNGLAYGGFPNLNGPDTLTIVTNDNGNTGGAPQTDTDTVLINVAPVNDAPVNSVPGAQIVAEDAALVFSSGNGNAITISDIDTGAGGNATVTLTVALGTLTLGSTAGLGSVSNDGTASVTLTGTVGAINAALDGLIYRGNLDFNGGDVLNVVTDDNGNTGSGGPLTDSDSVAITVFAVNDKPVNAVPGAQAVDEDATLTFSAANGNAITISDVDAGGAIVAVDLSVANGTLALGSTAGLTSFTNNAASISLVGTIANINAALDGLTYTGSLNFNGPDTLNIITDDVGNSGGGGPEQDFDLVNITVNPVNDTPANSVPGPQTVAEEGALVFTGANAITISDIDTGAGGSATVTLTVASGRLTLGSTAGVVVSNDGTASVTLTGTVSAINAALDGLTYRGNLDFNGGDVLNIVTNDNGNIGAGGPLTDTDTVAIDVTPVNDAPVISVPGTFSVAEDGTLVYSGASRISISDVDTGAGGNATVTLLVGNGTLTLGSTAGLGSVTGDGTNSVTLTGTVGAINAALDGLTYRGNPDFNGTDAVIVTTDDNGNTGAGGALTATRSFFIDVTPRNDAPVNSVPGPQTVAEEGALVFTGANAITISDVDTGAGGNATVTLTVASGTLTLGSTAGVSVSNDGTASVTLTGTVAAVNAALDGLTYRGNLNFAGGDVLNIVTNDNGNTGAGGPLTDTDTVTITVTEVNDAPVNAVPGVQTVAEEGTLVFSGANAITISDVDIGAGNGTVTLTVASGTLTLGSTAGLASFSNNGTASVTLSGTAAAINAALDGLTYVGNLNFAGGDSLSIVTSDNANTGTGGALTDTDAVSITVTPVNDAPAGINGTAEATESQLFVFSAANFPLTDALDSPANTLAAVRISSLPALGTLLYNGVAITQSQVDAGFEVSLADLNAGLLTFDPGSATPIDGFASFTFQVRDNGGTLNGGVDLDPSANTITIDINPAGPSIDLDDDNSTAPGRDYVTTYVEQGAAVAIADTDLTITSPSGTVTRATIIVTNAQINDTFAGSLPLPPGISGNVTTGNGTLIFELTGTASVAAYEAAIAGLRFTPGSGSLPDTPNTTPRSIDITLFNGASTGGTSTATINVQAVNDAVDLTPDTPAAAAYTENAAATPLLNSGGVSDPDGPSNFAGGSFTATITGNPSAGDQIVLVASSGFSSGSPAAGATNLYFNGHLIGTVTGLGTDSVAVTGLTSFATEMVVDRLTRAFGYQSSSEDPSAMPRTVTFTFNDGGNTGGPATQDTVTQVVNVTPVADPVVPPAPDPSLLAAGDIAIVGYNTDGADTFTFVLLKDIAAGTQINFTDRHWNGSAFVSSGSDSTITFTAPGAMTAGTLVTTGHAGFGGGALNLDSAGDTILAYRGGDASPTFLYAVDIADGNTTFANTLPTGLSLGTNAVGIGADNATYADRSNNLQTADLQQRIADAQNWTQNDHDEARQVPLTGNFLAAPDQQIWAALPGSGGLVRVNRDGSDTGVMQVGLYEKSANPPTQINHPNDIVFDTVHGLYFFADSDTGNRRILQGNIADLMNPGNTPPALTVLYSDQTPGTTNGQINGLAIDIDAATGQGHLYFVNQRNFNRITYDHDGTSTTNQTATTLAQLPTGRFANEIALDIANNRAWIMSTASNTEPVAVPAGTPGAIQDPDAIGTPNEWYIITTTIANNEIWQVGGLNRTDTSTADTTLTQLDLDLASASLDLPNANGLLQSIDVDPTTGLLYFVTQQYAGGLLGTGGVYTYNLATGAISNLYAETTATDLGLKYIDVDPGSGRYYVSNNSFADVGGANTSSILVHSLGGGTPVQFASASIIPAAAPWGLIVINAPTYTQTNAASPTYNEVAGTPSPNGAGVQLITSAAASDLDTAALADQLAGAQVRISAGLQTGAGHQDMLTVDSAIAAAAGITAVYNQTTGVLTLSGAATFDEYEAVLASVRFRTDGDNPNNYGTATNRTILFSVFDGLLYSDEQLVTVNVVDTNDVPVVDLDGNDSTQGAGNFATSYTASSAAVLVVDSDIVISDADHQLLQSATVVLTNRFAGDILSFAGPLPTGIVATVTTSAGDITVTFTGAATADAYELALRTLRFANSEAAPDLTQRDISVVLNDGVGGSITRHAFINLSANSAPVANDDTGSATESGAINTGSVASGNVRTNDTDTEDGSFGIVVSAVRTGAEAGVGTSGIVGSALQGAYGALTLREGGSFVYVVDNTNPTVNALFGAATLQDVFTYTVIDTGGATDTATLTITINAQNDTPSAIADTGTMSEDAPATLFNVLANDRLDPDTGAANTITASVISASGPGGSNITNADVTASVVSGQIQLALGADFQRLTASDTATIVVGYTLTGNPGDTATSNVTVTVTGANDVPIAVGDTGSMTEDEVKSFNVLANDTLDADRTAANTITTGAVGVSGPGAYGLDASDVTVAVVANQIQVTLGPDFQQLATGETATITVQYTLTGDAGDTSTATATITVSGLNDPPVVDLRSDQGGTQTAATTATFTENGGPVAVVPLLALSNPGGPNLTGATVTLTNAAASDVLSLQGEAGTSGTLANGIGFSIAGGTVTFTGTDSVSDYQSAMQLVRFNNTSEDPSASARSFSVTAVNGADTATSTATVNVTAVNDAPVNNGVPTTNQIAFSDTALPVSGLSVTDVDAGTGTISTTLSASNGTITVNLGASGATISGGANGSGSVTISGTVAQVNAALGNDVTFQSTGGFTGQASVTMVTNDGGNSPAPAAQDSDSFNIAVLPQIWFIDNTPNPGDNPGAPLGSQFNPFTSIAAFNAANGQPGGPGASDTVYLRAGTYSESDGINLLDGQTLIGQGENLQFANPFGGAPIVMETGSAGDTPVIIVTGAGNQGIQLAQNNTISGLDVGMADAGAVGIADGGATVGNLTISNVGVGVGQSTGTAIDIDQGGTLNVTLDSISSSGATTAIDLGSIAGLAGTGAGFTVTGATVIDDASSDGISITNSSLNATFGGKVTILNDAPSAIGDGVDLGTNTGSYNFNGGVDITVTGNNAFGFRATSSGTVNILDPVGNTSQITSTNGTAILVNPTTVNATLDSVTSGGGSEGISLTGMSGSLTIGTVSINGQSGDGIDITNSSGSVSINGGSIGGSNDPGGLGIDINGGTGAVSIAASVTKTGAGGNVIDVDNHETGNITFSGNVSTSGGGGGITVTNVNSGAVTFSGQNISITTTGSDRGVQLDNNAGGTINFTPVAGGVGFDISTVDGRGFGATGGGTINVTGTDNDISTFRGQVITWTDITIGASGANFDSLQEHISPSSFTKYLFSNVDGGTFNTDIMLVTGATNSGADGLAITGGSSATFNIANFSAGNIAGNAIEITGAGNGNVTIGAVLIDTVTGAAVLLDSHTGTFAINDGTITGGGNTGIPLGSIDINGGTGNVTIAADITKTTAGEIVEITGRTGGTITFTGNLTANTSSSGIDIDGNTGGTINFNNQVNLSTGAGIAVDLTNNTGAAINFNSTGDGLDIATTTGVGFNATGGGTVTVTGTGNTINSTSATALNVANTTIGAAGLNFQSISSGNSTAAADPVNGIVLNNTGTVGGLTVTGTGTTDDSGGIIQNTTGDAVVLTNTRFTSLSNFTIGDASTTPNTANGPIDFTPSIAGFGISMNNADDTTLTNVTIAKTGNSGIDGTGVTNLTITNSEILRAGNDNEENGISFDDFAGGTQNNLDGTVLIQNTVIDGYSEAGIMVENFTGTLNLTLDGVTIGRNKFESNAAGGVGGLNPFGEQGLEVRADGNANINVAVGGNSLFDAVDGNGIFIVSEGTGTVNAVIRDTTVQNSDALGIVLFGGSGDHTSTIHSIFNFDIIGDGAGAASSVKVTGTNSTAISIQPNGNSSMNGTVEGVYINGSTIGRGIEVLSDDASDAVIAIDNNTISNTAFNGIFANNADYGVLDIHIRNNNVSAPTDTATPSGLAVHGIEINPVPRGGADPADFLNITTLDISGNISNGNGPSGGSGFRLRERGDGVIFNLEGLAVDSNNTATVAGLVTSRGNVGTVSVTVIDVYDAVANGTTLEPHTPPAPLLAASMGSNENVQRLDHAALAAIVAAAVELWAVTGLNAEQLAALDGLGFTIDNLDGLTLGSISGDVVTIDADAAGHGWFVDPTPQDDSEFTATNRPGELKASAGAAAEGIDLFTTVMHEIGHALGFDHEDEGLMAATLEAGTRLLPQVTLTVEFDDVLIGDSAHNVITGGDGDEFLYGAGGSDVLAGGGGSDLLAGGEGADTFVIDASALTGIEMVDVIVDYDAAQGDVIDLTGLLEEMLGAPATNASAVSLAASGGNTDIVVDTNGAADGGGKVVATLAGLHQTVNILYDHNLAEAAAA